ncbi:MAG: glycosidase [Verrucomicrobia bacterium]|nr:glycosidase [Verrucomicrobiota bacterium]
MKLERYPGNPILAPHHDHKWEDLAVFNPAAWYDQSKREVLLLYRAAESGPEYKCWFGLAVSRDGFQFERVSDQPCLSPSIEGFDGATIQDPRIVKMGDWFYVTYACRHFPFGQFWRPEVRQHYITPDCPPEFPRYLRVNATLTGLAMTRDFKSWIRAGWITDPLLDDRDAVLFPERVGGRFALIHRPLEWVGPEYGTEHACAWIAFSTDLLGFPAAKSKLLIKNRYPWEAAKLGVNTPPIRTDHGWFTLYHAVGPDGYYRIGALLLDLEDPSVVLHRTPDWLMQPETDYEIEGYYRGVCFPCGAVVIDGRLFVYYGAGDKYCAVATCDFERLLCHLRLCPP